VAVLVTVGVADDLELASSYMYSMPDTILGPGQRASFTLPSALLPGEWSTVQGHADRLEPSTGTWEDDGNFRYQHEYLPVPGPATAGVFGLVSMIAGRRRRCMAACAPEGQPHCWPTPRCAGRSAL